MNMQLLNFKLYKPKDFIDAYIYTLYLIRKFMFYPGKIENITYLFDVDGLGLGILGVRFWSVVVIFTRNLIN